MNHSLDFRECNIFIIGDVILDEYVFGQVNRISPEAPVPVVHIKSKTNTLGGAGNVALNLVSLGCNVRLFGVGGNDESGRTISQILTNNKIVTNLVTNDSKPTTRKTRIIGHGQQLLRLDEEEIGQISYDESNLLFKLFSQYAEDADIVILSDYNKGVLAGDLPQRIIHFCKTKKIPVFVDPKRKDWERYQGAACITPNISEFEEITNAKIGKDEDLMVELAISVREKYSFEWIVITRGADGMCLIGRDRKPFFVKATAHEVFDVSGAGDTVIATLAAAVASGISYPEAVETANMAAGIVVGKVGSQPITLDELAAELRSKGSHVSGTGSSKILTLNAAEIKVKMWQAAGETIVFVGGYFGILDSKLVHSFHKARSLGSKLVIGLRRHTSANSVGKIADHIGTDQDRIDVLSALSSVDAIISYDDDTLIDSVRLLKPDILIKDIDQDSENSIAKELIESYGGTFIWRLDEIENNLA